MRPFEYTLSYSVLFLTAFFVYTSYLIETPFYLAYVVLVLVCAHNVLAVAGSDTLCHHQVLLMSLYPRQYRQQGG